MPIYLWEDEQTGYRVEVVRQTHDDYLDPPTDEDLPKDERGKERKWVKKISTGIRLTNPNKGFH